MMFVNEGITLSNFILGLNDNKIKFNVWKQYFERLDQQ
jgi:hypothetical protein